MAKVAEGPTYKVAVIGAAGKVGSAIMNALVQQNVSCTVIGVDVNQTALEGEVLDIEDGSFSKRTRVEVGKAEDVGTCDLVIVPAGIPQKNKDQTRAELLGANVGLFRNMVGDWKLRDAKDPTKFKNPKILIMVVANPVDTLTCVMQKITGLPEKQVFGSGTYLDSGRLRLELGRIMPFHPNEISINMIGEHGDRQFPVWSMANVGGQRLLDIREMKGMPQEKLDELAHIASHKAYRIIACKQATFFGVGSCVAEIAANIISNSKCIMPLVHYHTLREDAGDFKGESYYMSWPCSVGHGGVDRSIDCDLDEKEKVKYIEAAKAIKTMAALALQVVVQKAEEAEQKKRDGEAAMKAGDHGDMKDIDKKAPK